MEDSLRIKDPFRSAMVALRPFEPEDAPALQDYINHPELIGRRYLPGEAPAEAPLARQQVEAALRHWMEAERDLHLAVTLAADGALVGHAFLEQDWDPLSPSVALVIASQHQRRGLGSQVLGLLLAYLFDYTPAHNINSWVADWNTSGQQFLLHHGFQPAGRVRRVGLRQGRFTDDLVFDLLRPEWLARQDGGSHAAGR